MLIRCEKCNTLYELDEKLLPPHGAPVQCSKCQFVFTAYPGHRAGPALASAAKGGGAKDPEAAGPSASQPMEGAETELLVSGDTVVPASAAIGPSGAGRRAEAPAPAPESGGARGPQAQVVKKGNPPPAAPAPDEPQFTADGRPIRKVSFPTEQPAPSGPRPSLGRIPGRSVPSSRPGRRWALVVIPVALALALAAAFVAWRMLVRRSDPAAASRRPEGHSLFLRERLDPARGPAPGTVSCAEGARRTSAS